MKRNFLPVTIFGMFSLALLADDIAGDKQIPSHQISTLQVEQGKRDAKAIIDELLRTDPSTRALLEKIKTGGKNELTEKIRAYNSGQKIDFADVVNVEDIGQLSVVLDLVSFRKTKEEVGILKELLQKEDISKGTKVYILTKISEFDVPSVRGDVIDVLVSSATIPSSDTLSAARLSEAYTLRSRSLICLAKMPPRETVFFFKKELLNNPTKDERNEVLDILKIYNPKLLDELQNLK